MDIEKIAAKLKPLMPERIEKLMRARDFANPDMKLLIEKQIKSIAYKTFGDFNNKILLSLPPEAKAKGAINLGTIIYDTDKYPLGISEKELTQNMAILGRSGAGKTNATFHILTQLIDRKIPFVFLDWKRTARHLIPSFGDKLNIYTPGRKVSRLPFNPFISAPGIEANVYIAQLTDILSSAFNLGEGARSIIRKAIFSAYKDRNKCPNLQEVVNELEKLPDTGRQGGWKLTAMRALESLEFADLASEEKISQEALVKKMLEEFTVIELDGLGAEGKKFLVPLICLWLYYVRLGCRQREELKLVIFIEEAHHVLHKRPQTTGETILEMLLRQCRELGISIAVIDQHPHLLSSAAIGNTFTTIFLNQKDPSDINKAAAVCGLDAEDKRFFSHLPVGEAIVKLQDRWTSPVHIRLPLVRTDKGSISDVELARYSALKKLNQTHRTHQTHSARNTSEYAYPARVRQVRLFDMPLGDQYFRFLSDILDFPDDGVKRRYKRLSISADKGNNIKNSLIVQGWIEGQMIELGNTRKLCLRLTKRAKELLNLEVNTPQYGSIAHEYWKRFYGQRFGELGYAVSYEAPRTDGGRIDVVAVKDGRKIAIEIETGKSSFLQNIRQDLAAGYDRVLVVATGKTALEKIEKALIKEGLLIPPRVLLLPAGQEPKLYDF